MEPSSPEDEAIATLLYRHDPAGHSYRQVQMLVRDLPAERKQAVLAAAVEHRGPHDDLPRELQVGYAYAFDLLMDLGSFRDLHRHRRCIQIVQEPTPDHGADAAADVFPRAFGKEIGAAMLAAGLGGDYDAALEGGLNAARHLQTDAPLQRRRVLLPLAAPDARPLQDGRGPGRLHPASCERGNRRTLLVPRRVAWEMYEALRERSPALAALARPTDPSGPPDLLRR